MTTGARPTSRTSCASGWDCCPITWRSSAWAGRIATRIVFGEDGTGAYSDKVLAVLEPRGAWPWLPGPFWSTRRPGRSILITVPQPESQRDALCDAVERAFDVLGRKWTGLIIRQLCDGPRHFCDVERGVPAVSARMLTERLKELEAAGIVTRTVDTGTPVRTSYELTEKGSALIPVMRGIEQWARAWSGT
jgi:DNA-binding HxlR family transcriptional regulator